MKRIAILLAAAVLGLAATPGHAAPKKDFRIAWSIYVGWMPWGHAADTGIVQKWADKYGITVEVVQINDYIESINQYTAGAFDGCVMTNMDALTIPAAGGVDSTALIVGDYSNGNDGVVLKGTADLAAIKGRRVNLVELSVSHYLLARALRDYPAVRFRNVVFAGSVVERDYGWAELLRGGRVEHVANFRATADWVVAFFPKTLEMLGLQDLGAAGHDGFTVEQPLEGLVQPAARIVGGHGAALQEQMWDAIAGFVLSGDLTLPEAVETHRSAAWWVKFPAYAAPLVWLLIAGLLLLVLRWLLRLDLAEWQRTLALVGYGWLVWMVLTRV